MAEAERGHPLLARGRDRLETGWGPSCRIQGMDPLLARGRDRLETTFILLTALGETVIPYSLGDAIDWKQVSIIIFNNSKKPPLLARGRDRLETNH